MKWTNEEIDLGLQLLSEGKTFIDIANSLNKTQNCVTKKFNRLGYKSGYKVSGKKLYENYDWSEIQKKHDEEFSYREIIKHFKISPHAIIWGKNNNKLKFRGLKDGVNLSRKKGLGNKSKKEGLDRYRQLCAFSFSLNEYPNKFDFSLIGKHGWYKAKNRGDNLGGVSRDHMYSVKDGYVNNIEVEIIKHPANCVLMIHNENSKKNHNSSITLEELYKRIKEWNK